MRDEPVTTVNAVRGAIGVGEDDWDCRADRRLRFVILFPWSSVKRYATGQRVHCGIGVMGM